VRLEDEPVVQAQRKLHSFEQTLRPVSNNNQTLRLLFDFVVQDIEDFLEIFVERASVVFLEFALSHQTPKLAVQKRGRRLAPVVQTARRQAGSEHEALFVLIRSQRLQILPTDHE